MRDRGAVRRTTSTPLTATQAADIAAAAASRLARAGFVRAADEASLLVVRAGGDAVALDALLDRRKRGEPLAWLTGETTFCGEELVVHPGVYVPRPHTELVALRALAVLPAGGVAIDLCTGCGAIAAVLQRHRPFATVVASDVDPTAVACAAANGVDARPGDLFAPLPVELRGCADLVVAVVPYVPTAALGLLQRDTLAHESVVSYDGGPDGTALLRRVLLEATGWLRPRGRLVLELGGDEAALLGPDLARHGYTAVEVLTDDDGDDRVLDATWSP